MAFNGAGVYELPAPPTFPAVSGTKIRASYFNSTIQDLATALSLCWTRDGQSTATGTMNFLDVNVGGSLEVSTSITVAGAAVLTKRWATGEYVITASTTPPAGTIAAVGGTIGDAVSGATTRANSDTLALFSLLWASSTNAELQLQDSAGASVSRGVSAAADFALHRRLTVPNVADGDSLIAAVSSTVHTKSSGAVKTHAHVFTGTPVADHTHQTGTSAAFGGLGHGGDFPLSAVYADTQTGSAGGHTPAGTISDALGAANKAAGLFVKVYIAL